MMNNLGEIALNAIHIIESIKDGEYKSGKILFENIRHLSFKYDYLDIHYYEVNNIHDFKKIVLNIHSRSKNGEYPLVHFEAEHGHKEFFVLKDNSNQEWVKLLRLAQPINVQTRMKLLLSVGACESAYALSHMYRLLKEYAPCLALIGAPTLISGEELARQYTLFYTTLIEFNSLQKAIKVLKENNPNSNNRLLFIHAPEMFKRGMIDFYRKRYAGKNFEKNISRLVNIIKTDQEKFDSVYSKKSEKEIRDIVTIRSYLNQSINPKKYAEKFFMCDLYPEHFEDFEVQKVIEEIKLNSK